MAERLGWIAFGIVLGVVWGLGAALWYGTALAHGAVIGAALWGPAVFCAVPGPHAPVVENAS